MNDNWDIVFEDYKGEYNIYITQLERSNRYLVQLKEKTWLEDEEDHEDGQYIEDDGDPQKEYIVVIEPHLEALFQRTMEDEGEDYRAWGLMDNIMEEFGSKTHKGPTIYGVEPTTPYNLWIYGKPGISYTFCKRRIR